MEANPVKIMRLPSISIKENQDSDTKCYISIKTVFSFTRITVRYSLIKISSGMIT